MNTEEFVEYWDKTIKEWADSGGKIPESEQVWFESKSKLCKWSKLMPEPYWGNPENCSVVVLNYNPKGGKVINSNDHCYLGNKDNINTVCGNLCKKYSKGALAFHQLDEKLEIPFNNYKGTDWWKGRNKWLERISGMDNPRPFALEICAWHSSNWNCITLNSAIVEYLKTHLTELLNEAIRNSKFKIGLCIGKNFDKILRYLGYIEIKDIIKDIDYVQDLGYHPIKSINRWYRIYQVPGGSYIINTHSIGSNRPPSKKFLDFEKKIIETIKNKQNEKF